MLQLDQVKQIIENGVSKQVQLARDYSDLLNTHVTGLNVDNHLEEFVAHESDKQREIRKRLQKSNKSIFSFLLRPLDKIFTAKGGSIYYNLSESQIDKLKLYISDVSEGLNIKNYLKKIVKEYYIIDPNAFLMLDLDKEGNYDTKIFTSQNIIYKENRGNQVTAVVFNPYTSLDEKDTKEYYRVVDEKTDSIYIKDGNDIYLDESSVLENFFGRVPAYILGDSIDVNTGLFKSLIDDVLDDAKEHLRDTSVKVVHKLSHGFTKYWQRPEACTTCGGEGTIKGKDEDGDIIDVICPSCNGTKIKSERNTSDITLVPIPGENEKDIAPNIAGFISPDLKIWEAYKKDIQDLRNDMYQDLWGTTYSIDSKNETATGKMLNVQPQAERVAGISQTFSKLHEFVLDIYGALVFFNNKYKSEVTYGTRYLMESPDELLKRFKESKEGDLPIYLQNDLLIKYYQTEYSTNNQEFLKNKKIIATDPFPNQTANQLKELGVSEEEILLKIYHPQWLLQLTEAKKILMSEDELRNDLKIYVSQKKISKTIENEVQ